jgi:Cys-rich protein (TIGR01571 family)
MMQEKSDHNQASLYPPVPPMGNGQPVYNQQGAVYVQPTATYTNQNYNPQYNQPQQVMQHNVVGIPDIRHNGKWRDSLCDCFNNLWPSCGCQIFVGHGAWLIGQISQKLGFLSFNAVVIPFIILFIITWILQRWKENMSWLFWIPYLYILIIQVFLRFHFVRYYNISENGSFIECLISCCCFPCSTCQMARHAYGYSKRLDGDSDMDLGDNYAPIQVV